MRRRNYSGASLQRNTQGLRAAASLAHLSRDGGSAPRWKDGGRMSASDARSANWRNLAADIGDLKETDRWVRANARDEVEADAAMKWYAEHATELPQLTTDMHPHDQMRVIECGGSVDGITAEYDPGGTTNPEFVEETDED